MKMETKYLSDGRKVAVVGSLNQQETIVQEIFVTDSGDEIPSGERFVTKSLHDEPVKSWKQKEIEKIEALHEKMEREKKSINIEIRKLKAQRVAHQELIKSNLKVIEMTTDLTDEDIDLIACVASGCVEWTVDEYYWWKPSKFDKETFQYDGRYDYRDCEFEGIKMITLLGVGGGKFRFEINRWRDGSGSSRGAMFFKSDSQLKEFLINKVNESESLSLEQINSLSMFIDIPEDMVNSAKTKHKELAEKSFDDEVRSAKERLDKKLGEINVNNK